MSAKIGPDELAGIPVTFDVTFSKPAKRSPSKKKAPFVPPLPKMPTADDLAGIPFCVEEMEDTTVRPRQRRRKR